MIVFLSDDSRGSAPTIEEADEWPSIKEVRGRVIFQTLH